MHESDMKNSFTSKLEYCTSLLLRCPLSLDLPPDRATDTLTLFPLSPVHFFATHLLRCVLRQINKSFSRSSPPKFPLIPFSISPAVEGTCDSALLLGVSVMLYIYATGAGKARPLLYTSSPSSSCRPSFPPPPPNLFCLEEEDRRGCVEKHGSLAVESLGLPSCFCSPLWW
jgi:hypothetical protein